jgi:uncharacterized oligopeptide transporter (OPT) family protein
LFATDKDVRIPIGELAASGVRLGPLGSPNVIQTGGVSVLSGPTVSPAYMGVGYVIGPELAALQFSGSVLAWGLLVPLFMFFWGRGSRSSFRPRPGKLDGKAQAAAVWRYIVRPIAVGGMLVGARTR